MSASQCPALELDAGTLYSSVCPHGEAVRHFCLPGFCLHSVYPQPVTEHFYLSPATPFGVSKLCCLLWHAFTPLLQGVGGRSCPGSAACWATTLRAVAQPLAVHGLWQHPAESPLLRSLVAAGFPAQMPGNSPTLRQPCSFCDSGDPEPRLSHLGFHPVSPPECLSSRDVPHRSRLLKVPICTRLLYHFLKAGLWMLPPLTVYLPIYPLGFTSLHLLPCQK